MIIITWFSFHFLAIKTTHIWNVLFVQKQLASKSLLGLDLERKREIHKIKAAKLLKDQRQELQTSDSKRIFYAIK